MYTKVRNSSFDYHRIRDIYRFHKRMTDLLVKTGEISADVAETVWASRVAEDMAKLGFKTSKKILNLLK